MYADDTTLVCSGNSITELQGNINECMDNVMSWFNSNHLVVNATKSNFMLVGTRQKLTSIGNDISVVINGNLLQQCTSAKLLGVMLDPYLSFDDHILYLRSKIAPKIGFIHRLRRLLPQASLNAVYVTCIQSLIDYCLTVYGNCTAKNRLALQRLQNRAARAVVGLFDYNVSVSQIIKELHWFNIDHRFLYFMSVLMYKCLNNMSPLYLSNKFAFISHENYTTRSASSMNLFLPRAHNALFQHSLVYSGPSIWNSLPRNIKECSNLATFKAAVRNYYLSTSI